MADELKSISTEVLEAIPAGDNPFWHDGFNMGTQMGKDVMIMHVNHSTEECNYLIIVNMKTGERMKVRFS